MFVCEIAMRFPTVIVARARSHMMVVQSGKKPGKAVKKTRTSAENPAAFTPVAIKAVMEVGAPSSERPATR
jgi:hypothetical protein